MFLKSTEATINFIQLEFARQGWPSYKAFAAECGLKSPATISRMMNGLTISPHYRTVRRMINALGYRIKTEKYTSKRKMQLA